MNGRRTSWFVWAQGPTLVALLALASPVFAVELAGRVISVHDGDTLTVLVARKQIRVRLTEIDAPELAQPFGQRSRKSLSDLCFGTSAVLVSNSKDRNGRALARVMCGPMDVNAEQVRRGMAWVFDRYVTDRNLYRLQDEARRGERGLWTDSKPVPPWQWRKQKGTAATAARRQ